jgi:hypothetical protein
MATKDKAEKVVRTCERCGLKVTGTMVKVDAWSPLTTFQPDKHKCYPRS